MLRTTIITTMLFFSSFVHASECQSDDVKLQVLGSGGPELDDGRNSSSYIIWHKNKAKVLVDVGPGASADFSQTGAKFEDLDAVLFTHLHADHSADFPAFVKGSYFTDRSHDLTTLGPTGNDMMPAMSEYLDRMFGEKGAYAYLNSFLKKEARAAYKVTATDVPLTRGKVFEYPLGDGIKGHATVVDHGPIAAIAWRVEVAGCTLVFSGDMTNRFDVLSELAKEAHLLVANNAIPEQAPERAKSLHMPPSQIGLIAKQAQVKKLLLSHFMNRTLTTQSETQELIRANYKGTIELATDGLVIGF